MATPGSPSPTQRYLQGTEAGHWRADAAQMAILPVLDRICAGVLQRENAPIWRRLLRAAGRRPAVQGLYLHGGVGCGKTFLMDLLPACLPPRMCARWHFHRLMKAVHAGLARNPGQRDPLRLVAAQLVPEPLLCLDEFLVQDIGDAMILAELLRYLVRQGTVLVMTSNTPPQHLYRDGLQRAKFVPAIQLIERRCAVIGMHAAVDYRLRALTAAPVYRCPHDAEAERALHAMFEALAPGKAPVRAALTVNDRPLPVHRFGEGVVWFTFSMLCEGPRSVADYIEIAQTYNTVLLSEVPELTVHHEDAARRFVFLIDELYDRRVKLIVSAARPVLSLYTGARLQQEFQRTQSRLIEMQSEAYLALEHRP